VITHLPQMAERLPQGVEVLKEGAGSRIVRR
jgi:DNA repair exonuclease SbcCD ATPase subunit